MELHAPGRVGERRGHPRRAAGGGRRARGRGARAQHPVPDRAGARRRALGLPPALPDVDARPATSCCVLFLPPLLYSGAFFANLRELRTNLRADLAAVDRAGAGDDARRRGRRARADRRPVRGPAAFALGRDRRADRPASPATAIARRLGVPRRSCRVLEGEAWSTTRPRWSPTGSPRARPPARPSRCCDAGWDVRLEGARAGSRSASSSAGSIARGPPPARRPAGREHDRPADGLRRLRAGRARSDVSAVLAAVTGGCYVGWQAPQIASPATRLQGFGDVGAAAVPAQRVPVRADRAAAAARCSTRSTGTSPATLLGYGGGGQRRRDPHAAGLAAHVVFVIRALDRRASRARAALDAGSDRSVVGWAGMRGAVSLAAALALPARLPAARPAHLPHLRGHLRHARAAGADAAAADPLARRASTTAREEHEELKARLLADQGGAGAGSTSSRPRTGRATTRSSACAALYRYRKRRLPRARARSRTTATRTARSPTRRSCARCWRRSGGRSCGCATRATISNERHAPDRARARPRGPAAGDLASRPWRRRPSSGSTRWSTRSPRLTRPRGPWCPSRVDPSAGPSRTSTARPYMPPRRR